jgi:pyruvate-formate lyase-activating enzyme
MNAKIVVSTYNEPLITSEWAVAIFKEARGRGLMTGFVSNGNGTPRVLEYLRHCQKFWNRPELKEWIKTIEDGGTPYFGANLDY